MITLKGTVPYLFASMMFWPVAGNAACVDTGTTSSCTDVTIDDFYVHGNGYVYIGVDTDLAPVACTPLNGIYVALYPGTANFEEFYSLFLTAFLNQTPMAVIRLKNTTSPCEILYARQESADF